MKTLIPGHSYQLDHVVAGGEIFPAPSGTAYLHFLKRVGPKFPGNTGRPSDGPTSQEVMRALIARAHYVDSQDPHPANKTVIGLLRSAIVLLERRAASRRDDLEFFQLQMNVENTPIEDVPTCAGCGHIYCQGHGSKR